MDNHIIQINQRHYMHKILTVLPMQCDRPSSRSFTKTPSYPKKHQRLSERRPVAPAAPRVVCVRACSPPRSPRHRGRIQFSRLSGRAQGPVYVGRRKSAGRDLCLQRSPLSTGGGGRAGSAGISAVAVAHRAVILSAIAAGVYTY